MFCKQLDMDLDDVWQEMVKQQQLKLEKFDLLRAQRREAIKGASKFCKDCFEQSKPHCDCLLNKLGPKQRAIAMKEFAKVKERQGSDDESSFCPEFNDSHDFDISSEDESTDRLTVTRKQSTGNTLKVAAPQSKKNVDLRVKESGELIMEPDKAFREQRDKVQKQIAKMTKPSDVASKE